MRRYTSFLRTLAVIGVMVLAFGPALTCPTLAAPALPTYLVADMVALDRA